MHRVRGYRWVDVTRLPRVIDHRSRVAERPAVRRALAAELAAA